MANTPTLQATQPKIEKLNPRAMIGGILEDAFETITGVGTGYVNEGPVTGRDLENLSKMPELKAESSFPATGEFTGFQIPRTLEKTDEQLLAEQRAAVAEAESILKQSRNKFVTQEEIRYEIAGMSEEDRNKRLRLNTSLRKEHTENAYHMAELYRQIKREVYAIKRQEGTGVIPSPAKQPNSLEVVFEGKSGSTGNLSFQAVS